MGVHWAEQLAEEVKMSHGYSVEILDLRSLAPIDTEAIVQTVTKNRSCTAASGTIRNYGSYE